jgi:hypothetical protein
LLLLVREKPYELELEADSQEAIPQNVFANLNRSTVPPMRGGPSPRASSATRHAITVTFVKPGQKTVFTGRLRDFDIPWVAPGMAANPANPIFG